jgi:hypothetical protein
MGRVESNAGRESIIRVTAVYSHTRCGALVYSDRGGGNVHRGEIVHDTASGSGNVHCGETVQSMFWGRRIAFVPLSRLTG